MQKSPFRFANVIFFYIKSSSTKRKGELELVLTPRVNLNIEI